jgi:short-subunit dehydrogenase
MRARRSGIIINMSSAAGIQAKASRTMYSASKFALEAFSEALYAEMKSFNVRVLLVEPGWFRSKFSDKISTPSVELPKDYEGTIVQKMMDWAAEPGVAPVSTPFGLSLYRICFSGWSWASG